MDDIPWIPLAMVVIAFLTWLKNRIEEASERRREIRARREAAQRARNSAEPAAPSYQSPYREEEEEVFYEEEVVEAPKTFRELMAEIEASNREAAPERPSSPPPLPKVSTPTAEPEIFENQFPTSLPDITAKPASPRPSLAKSKTGQTNTATHPLASSLKNRSQLRNALILKEILDKPRALQK